MTRNTNLVDWFWGGGSEMDDLTREPFAGGVPGVNQYISIR